MDKIISLIKLVRYRFFIFAGLLPYLLGATVAYRSTKAFDPFYFLVGFLGVIFILITVETFNEYFDSKMGSDRVFSNSQLKVSGYVLCIGLICLFFAFAIGWYLTMARGWLIIIFAVLGFLTACFYVAPPVRWAYRGFGEIIIAISYGPLLILGSYYLQTKKIDSAPIIASIIPGLLIFSLAILNEMPDYYQDRLVGKKNIVVRLGRNRSIKILSLSWICAFVLLGAGIWWKKIPHMSFVAFLMLPLVLNSIRIAKENIEKPEVFISAIRMSVITYIVVVFSLGISYLGG